MADPLLDRCSGMKAESTRTYIVLPFERAGTIVGARQARVFDDPGAALFYAAALGQRTTGVALLERTINAETGEEDDRLVASGGAVPPFTPSVMQWTMHLH